MNSVLLSLTFITAGLLACNQQPRQQQTEAKADTAIVSPYFYMQLKGTIANQPVTMHLHKTNPDVYRGYYAYDKIGEPIDIWGGIDSSQQLTLYENSYTGEEITFKGKFDPGGSIKGTWRGAGTSHPFSLKKDFDRAIQFDVYRVTDSSDLVPGHSHSPKATASNSILWPAEGTDGKTADFIKSVLSGGKADVTPRQLVKKDVDSFLLFYKGSAIDLDTSLLGKDSLSPVWDWTSEGDMKVIWNRYPLLVLESFTYDYTGGAHGNSGAIYQVLDLTRQKILRVEDVFQGDYKTVLTKELELAFRRKYKVPEDEPVRGMLMVDNIEPNNNFILTNKGVMFSYTPYEIGPYALGQVSLFVPYSHIKAVLKEDYSK